MEKLWRASPTRPTEKVLAVGLSNDEQRELALIERQLSDEDPRLAQLLADWPSRSHRRSRPRAQPRRKPAAERWQAWPGVTAGWLGWWW